jgi:signal transduction histidine kinase
MLEEICFFIGIALRRQSLSEENNLLIQNLETALKQKEKANLYNSEFLASISHKIRTPLTGILGFNSLMTSDDNLTKSQTENLKLIEKSGERLLLLLEDILEISAIEARKIVINQNTFRADELKRNIESTFEYMLKENNVSLVFELNGVETIYSDVLRINQILLNLVGNAIKFSINGTVAIKIKKTENEFIFNVVDNGKGINKDNSDKIFGSFYVGENSSNKKYHGTGLGLPICKRLVELLGGKIWFESEIEKGASFYFTIPVQTLDNLHQAE